MKSAGCIAFCFVLLLELIGGDLIILAAGEDTGTGSLQDSEFTETFVHDGEPLPPDLRGFRSAGDARIFFNAQSVPQFGPIDVRILVEGGLLGTQLDNCSGDPFVQQSKVLRKLRKKLSPSAT